MADVLPVVKGTLDVLVLKALSWGPMHGFEVTTWLEDRSGGALDVEDSALYQAFYRLEARNLVAADWGVTDNNRRARYYKITQRRSRAPARADCAVAALCANRERRPHRAGALTPCRSSGPACAGSSTSCFVVAMSVAGTSMRRSRCISTFAPSSSCDTASVRRTREHEAERRFGSVTALHR